MVNNDPETASDVQRVVNELLPTSRIINNQTNLGQAGSKNLAIHEASGDVIAILDDDDRWHPRFLAAHADAHAAAPDVGVVYCDHIVFWDDAPLAPRVVYGRSPPPNLFSEMVKGRFTLATNSIQSIKRSILIDVGGYDTSLIGYLDWDLLCRLAQKTSFVHIPEPLAFFRMHLGVRDSDPLGRLRELERLAMKWKQHPEVDELITRFAAEELYGASRNAVLRGNRLDGLRRFGGYLGKTRVTNFNLGDFARLSILVAAGAKPYAWLQRQVRSLSRRQDPNQLYPPANSTARS